MGVGVEGGCVRRLGKNNGTDARMRGTRGGETGIDIDNNEKVELLALLTIRMRALREGVQMFSRLMAGW